MFESASSSVIFGARKAKIMFSPDGKTLFYGLGSKSSEKMISSEKIKSFPSM